MDSKKPKISDIYKEAGLMYIRYDAEIETKSNGQKKIGGNAPVVLPSARWKNSPRTKTVSIIPY